MAFVNPDELHAPVLRTEIVTVESLGGDVLVRGRKLAESMRLSTIRQKVPTQQEGESPEDAEVRAVAEMVTLTLAMQVCDGGGRRLWSAEQWAIWGGAHPSDLARLHEVAERLSGSNTEAVRKN